MKTRLKTKLALAPDELKAQQKKERAEKKIAATATGQRNARGQWIKGVSGNDLGRPRSALAELCREQVTKHGLVSVLGNVAARTGDYGTKKKIQLTVADQINAIRLLLLYGYGMPKNEIDTGDVRIEVTYADNRQVNIANSAPGTGENYPRGETLQRTLMRPEIWQDDSGNGSVDSSGSEG